MKMRFAGVIVAVFLSLVGCRHQAAPKPVLIDDARRQQHVESFDKVWSTIKDQHWDKNLNGADWNAARDELRPKVAAAKTDNEARAAMMELIDRLKQSHFSIIPAESYARVEGLPDRSGDQGPTAGFSGLHIRIVDNQAMITEVEKGSAAEQAGIRAGWIVLRAGKFDVDDVLDRVRSAYAGSKLLAVYETMSVQNILGGNLGERLTLTLIDGLNKKVKKEVVLAAPLGKPAKFGNLPTFYIRTDVKEVAPKIGYVAFSAFFDPPTVSTAFKQAIERFQNADGLIIDLRGNPGGIGFMANGMAGYLIDKPGLKLGTMTMRTGEIMFVVNPQPTVFKGPVAVLVDEGSMSTSEIMAGGLKDIGRARVFGTPTPGAALPSRIEKLPNGDGFQYAFANYVSAKGDVLEGKGVTPDEIIKPQRAALLAGQDAVINAAVAWIKSQQR